MTVAAPTNTFPRNRQEHPAVTSPDFQSLNAEDWSIRPLDDSVFPLEAPIPAIVPGNVQDDLERAGVIAPLSVGLGDPRWHEIALTGWRYERQVAVSASPGERVFLEFDGVDFSCRVLVDEHEVTRHSGMFRRFVVDVTAQVVGRETYTLAVEIDPMPAELLPVLIDADGAQSGAETAGFFVFANNRIRRTLKDLKSPATCSYDWATNTWALGIWRDVTQRVSGAARISDVRAEALFAGKRVSVDVEVALDTTPGFAGEARITLLSPTGVPTEARVVVNEGATNVAARIPVVDPMLWWPVGHGDQPLYRVMVEVIDTGGGVSDRSERRIGLREVRWEQVDGVAEDFINPFMLVINGTRVRTMGSNLVSPDLLFGRNNRGGDWFIRAAVHTGMNTVRIHGGGVVLPPAMYDLADELGLLILHEFPVGNCLMEDDPVFLANLGATVGDIVRQLRHHPSIIEWSGGNELHWLQRDDYPALETMRAAIAAEDTRLFRATCPMEGSRHSPWHYDHEWFYRHYADPSMTDNLGENPLMRYGEFGTQSPAHLDVWERDIPAASRWPLDSAEDPILVRKNATNAVFSDEFWMTVPLTEELFGVARSLPDLIRAGQFLGAEGIRFSIDALRARGGSLGGFTTWDFNEPWSNAAGSFLIDYDGRGVMAYDFFAESLAPVSVSLAYDAILHPAGDAFVLGVQAVSDESTTVDGIAWRAEVYDVAGTRIAEHGGEVGALAPLEARTVGEVSVDQPADGSPVLVRLATFVRGHMRAERLYAFGAEGVRAPLAALLPQGRQPDPSWIGTAGVNPAASTNRAAAANGGRVHAVSGAETRDHDPVAGLIDGRYATSRDGFGSGAVWQSPTAEGWFVLEPAAAEGGITRILLGRDRSGTYGDRTLDALVVEVSDDAENWTPVLAHDRLAALLGDRERTSQARSNPGLGEQLGRRAAYRPIWTLDIAIPETTARYWRFVVRGRPEAERFVALDEVELYSDPAVRVSAPTMLVRDAREQPHALARTVLHGELGVEHIDTTTAERRLEIEVRNDGTALAVFCEVTARGGARPRVLSRGANISIPPGESRVIELTAGVNDPPLAEREWEVVAWNSPAQPVSVRSENAA
ncbi:hypothetical protein J2X85_001609 [Microbacterium trichothecenolyticum]|uniref:glycoside hydrolase family 2 protein n=1 Tax=Microbacterium trichothecenolyticum TaxID=69370 RepID=UPI002867267F|nr:hypothetical protein [Microbacterium trichothecenolyticum]MDR7184586.1 hypothetical protein [Microbacterium trichothecenolyticum]